MRERENERKREIFSKDTFFNNNMCDIKLRSQYYKQRNMFLCLLSERREMRASKKMSERQKDRKTERQTEIFIV